MVFCAFGICLSFPTNIASFASGKRLVLISGPGRVKWFSRVQKWASNCVFSCSQPYFRFPSLDAFQCAERLIFRFYISSLKFMSSNWLLEVVIFTFREGLSFVFMSNLICQQQRISLWERVLPWESRHCFICSRFTAEFKLTLSPDLKSQVKWITMAWIVDIFLFAPTHFIFENGPFTLLKVYLYRKMEFSRNFISKTVNQSYCQCAKLHHLLTFPLSNRLCRKWYLSSTSRVPEALKWKIFYF